MWNCGCVAFVLWNNLMYVKSNENCVCAMGVSGMFATLGDAFCIRGAVTVDPGEQLCLDRRLVYRRNGRK